MKSWTKREVRRKLLRRIFPFCMGIVIVILSSVASFGHEVEASAGLDDFDKAAVQTLQAIASGIAGVLNVYMDARVTEMLVCASLSERFKEALSSSEMRADANRKLEEWLKTSGAYEAILVLDKTGTCLASAPAGLVNRDFSNNPAFQAAVKGKLTILDARKSDAVASLDPKSKGWTATIAVPIKVENKVDGVLMSFLKWSRLAALVMSAQVGKTGYVWVLNSQNQVIIHPAEHLYGESVRGPKIRMPLLDDAIKKKVPYLSYEFENIRTRRADTKLVAMAYPQGYGNFPGLGWTIGAGADRAELGPNQSLLKIFLRHYFFR
jgi:methyl-accepting chemotaxis protein